METLQNNGASFESVWAMLKETNKNIQVRTLL
jgi:hypothetical protein